MPSLVDVTNAYRFTPAGDLADRIRQIATDRARDYDIRDRYDAAAQRALRRLVAFATSPNHLIVLTIGLDEELALAAVAEVATSCIELAAEELGRDHRAGHIQVSEDGRVLAFDLLAR